MPVPKDTSRPTKSTTSAPTALSSRCSTNSTRNSPTTASPTPSVSTTTVAKASAACAASISMAVPTAMTTASPPASFTCASSTTVTRFGLSLGVPNPSPSSATWWWTAPPSTKSYRPVATSAPLPEVCPAKVSHLALLPQGKVEAADRVRKMVMKMDELGFGSCTNTYACEAECPKEIKRQNIARLNRQWIGQLFGRDRRD